MGQQPEVDALGDEAGDPDRFETLYRRHLRAVTVYCARRIDPDRVQDAVAETFVVMWRRLDDIPDGEAGLLWLYRVASRVVGHDWRGSRRRRRLADRLASRRQSMPQTPEEATIDGDETRRVLEAAARLDRTDAEILRLFAWEGLGASQIAVVLEIKPNAVHQRLHRARQHLVREFDLLDSDTAPIRPAPAEGGL